MKLKRYIRSGGRIFDLTTQSILGDGYHDENSFDYTGYHVEIGKDMSRTSYGDIVATADSIIDLATKGDLIELDYDSDKVIKDVKFIVPIINAINGDLILQDGLFIYKKKEHFEHVKYLWVRQDKDIFKRYEVQND